MPCGHCGHAGHNRRTCQKYDGQKVAEMICAGAAKDVIFRAMDMVVPGSGATTQLVTAAINFYNSQTSKTISERKRGVLDLLMDGAK